MKPLVWFISLLLPCLRNRSDLEVIALHFRIFGFGLKSRNYGTSDSLACRRSVKQNDWSLVCHGVDAKNKSPLGKKWNLKPADLSSEQYQMKKAEDLAAIIGGYGKKAVHLVWENKVYEPLSLPSTQIRQVLINLSLIGRFRAVVQETEIGESPTTKKIFLPLMCNLGCLPKGAYYCPQLGLSLKQKSAFCQLCVFPVLLSE